MYFRRVGWAGQVVPAISLQEKVGRQRRPPAGARTAYVVTAPGTPRMARFTRFRISGTL
jgi:hypothetical protein